MKYSIVFTDSYTRRAEKFLRKHPELLKQYRKSFELLEFNPFHPSLRLHSLKGALDGLYSVSINMSYRITLEFLVSGSEILPVDVGKHDEVY